MSHSNLHLLSVSAEDTRTTSYSHQ